MPQFKPAGYSTVSPYLIVTDAAATIRFLERVLGGKQVRSFPDDQGRLMHAEVRIDDTVIMLADSAPGWQPVPAYAHVYVEDVDSTYERALAEGAESVQVPEQKGEEEDKRGGVKDAGGTTWWISTRV